MSYDSKGSLAATIVVSLSPDLRGNYVCSGAADEVEINLALVEALRRGGGTVLVLEGIYTLAAPITFPGNRLVLRGEGPATFLDGDALATGNHAIVISGVLDSTVRDLSIQTQDGGTKTCHCIFIEDNANRFRVEDVTIIDSDSDGIRVEGADILDGWIVGNAIVDADDYGILVTMDGGNYARRLHIKDNTITSAGANGILGVDLVDCEIHGNIVTGSIIDGIELNLCTQCSVNDNHCYGNAGHGIAFANADWNTIEGNECHDNDVLDTATYDGIYVDSSSTNNVIIGNMCEGNHRYGIGVDGALNIVQGNMVANNDLHGIYHDGLNSEICNNLCIDNGVDTNNTYDGISLGANADYSVVSDNKCIGDDTRQRHGIYVGNGAVGLSITGNICNANASDGIHLAENNDYCLITDNQLTSNVDDGIEIAAATCNNNHVKDNYFNGNGGNCLVDTGTDTATHEWNETAENPDANIGRHPAEQMLDGVETTVRLGFTMPMEFQEVVTAQMVVVAAGTGNLAWDAFTDFGKLCSAEDYNAHSDSVGASTTGLTINDLECVDVSAALTGVLAGDRVGLEFWRDGDHADDTIGANVYVLEFRLRYV